MEGEGKEGKIVKGEEENLKWKGERYENEQRTFFFFFCLSLFETTEICLGVPKWKFFFFGGGGIF